MQQLLQQRLQEASRIGMGEQAAASLPLNTDEARIKGIELQVFISLGMPEATLRAYFQQAKAIGPTKVRFMLRGFHPKQVALTIARLRALFPDPLDDDFIVDVDPPAFRELGVKAVPVILARVGDEKDDQWLRFDGERSLTGALELAQNPERAKRLAAAPLYEIEEPDTIELLNEMARSDNWAAHEARMREQAERLEVQGFALPKARKTEQRWHEPRVEIPEDVVINGQVLARKGQAINPLQHQSFDATIIVIDGKDKLHLKWAAKQTAELASKGKTVDVFVTAQGRVAMADVMRELPRASGIYQMFPTLAQAFGAQAVPAIIEAQGQRFLVQEFSVLDVQRSLQRR